MFASTFAGQAVSGRSVVACAPRRACTIEAAHKKGAGSTKNGRDSNSKSRGVKVYGGQPVKAGGIIVRQLGTTWYPGENAALGKDYTLFSTIDGIVVYHKRHEKSEVNVYPLEHAKAVAAVTASHSIAPKEGVPSRSQRHKQLYKPRSVQRAEAGTEPAASKYRPAPRAPRGGAPPPADIAATVAVVAAPVRP